MGGTAGGTVSPGERDETSVGLVTGGHQPPRCPQAAPDDSGAWLSPEGLDNVSALRKGQPFKASRNPGPVTPSKPRAREEALPGMPGQPHLGGVHQQEAHALKAL